MLNPERVAVGSEIKVIISPLSSLTISYVLVSVRGFFILSLVRRVRILERLPPFGDLYRNRRMIRNNNNKEERTDWIRMFRFNFVSIFLAKKAFFNIMIKIQIKIK